MHSINSVHHYTSGNLPQGCCAEVSIFLSIIKKKVIAQVVQGEFSCRDSCLWNTCHNTLSAAIYSTVSREQCVFTLAELNPYYRNRPAKNAAQQSAEVIFKH